MTNVEFVGFGKCTYALGNDVSGAGHTVKSLDGSHYAMRTWDLKFRSEAPEGNRAMFPRLP